MAQFDPGVRERAFSRDLAAPAATTLSRDDRRHCARLLDAPTQGRITLKQVIFTADDFGLSPAVNLAVERAHREGVLNTTSLMVGASAAADAVARARRNPGLRVGLHLVVVDGRPVLPATALPALVDVDGRFGCDLLRAGLRYFFLPAARRQLAREIRAQFEAFRATGLELDHVDSHHHLHLHPTILGLLLEIGRDYGLRAVRVPAEPALLGLLDGEPGATGRRLTNLFLLPWTQLIRRRLRARRLATTDCVVGLHDTGRMNADRLQEVLRRCPDGSVEIFLHPAVADAQGPWPLSVAASAEELAALLSPAVSHELAACGIRRVSFSELAGACA